MTAAKPLYTSEVATCPLLHEADNRHLPFWCEDCDIALLSLQSRDRVDEMLRAGCCTAAQHDAYVYVWTLKPPLAGHLPVPVPLSAETRRIARKMLRGKGFEVPGELLEWLELGAAA